MTAIAEAISRFKHPSRQRITAVYLRGRWVVPPHPEHKRHIHLDVEGVPGLRIHPVRPTPFDWASDSSCWEEFR